MAIRFQLFTVFCVIVLSVNAQNIDQPQLYVANNNLHFQMPRESYIKFAASKIKVNDIDLLKTLEGAQNVTQLLPNYKMFISQFHSKMDDMENKLVNIRYDPETNSTNVTVALAQLSLRITGFNTRIFGLRRSIRRLQQLLTTDECASNPCKNGGSCFDLFNGFLCQCANGWEGPTCQTDINECARFVGTDLGCQNGGTCLNHPGTYQCQCTNGWIGLHCNRKPSDCNSGGSEICGHGTCIPQNNEAGYKCLCDQGWTNDGTHKSCTVDVDECKQNHPPCSTNPLVQCVNLPGSFTCQHCPLGYTGNGYYCADINECELFNGGCSVSPYVECLNTPGSSKCGPCPAGYEGDGKTCMFKGICNVNNGGCSILARCILNPAIAETYVQCICPEGYTGSGIGPAGCTKTSSTGCSPNPCLHGTCVATRTSPWFTCTCNSGFSGTYCDQRYDPCASNPCLNGGTCLQRRSRFTCSCMNGFTGRFCQFERQACGDNLNLSNGTISYPTTDFDSSRGTENLSCAWTIKTQKDKVIQVNFTKFNFADAPCTSQWFQVHDGRNSLAPALGRFCGKTLPFNGSLTTTHNVIYFWLRTSGNSGKKPEFQMSWITKDAACGGLLSQSGIGLIVSPGWPNNYPNNRECSWRFSVPVEKRLLFHVYALNIGQNSGCTGDYLEFYTNKGQILPSEVEVNSGGAKSQLFAKLCNSTIPSPFYSLSNTGYILFKSNEKDTHTGFQIGYSVVDGIPGCGGTYTNKDGYIQSIEVTSSMPLPLICTYEIKLNVNTTIMLEIVEIDLEQDCDDTNIAIYLKTATDTSLISKYCGNKIPGPFETFGSNILIKSLSKYHYKNHWKIRYEAVCHQLYTKPADSISADPSWKECRYLIEQPPGNIILLDWRFDRGYSPVYSIARSYVEFWDGDSENSTLIAKYRDSINQKIRIESTTNYLLIKTRTGAFDMYMPFTATYTTLDLGCGGLLKNDLGTIAYPPKGIEKYSANGKCRWVIMAPPGKVVQLTWMTFNLEQSFDCSYDNLQVFDNNTDIGMGGLVGKYCGYTLPPVMLSSSNIMTINFVSDTTIHGDGFLVSYTFIRENNVCGGNYFTPAGVIKSPGYPENYPTNRECIWTITVQPGSQIMLKTSNFSLESYSGCRYDWLEIRNGGSSSSPLIGKYCGTTFPKTIPSHTNKLYLKFNSDMSRTDRGFKIEWSSAATGCGGTLTSPSGSIMSPHYPEPYTKSTDCLWKITVSAGSKIQLIFADIDLEKHSACGLDYVQLFDGPTINSKSLGKFCSPQTNAVVSTKNTILVRFRSDISFQGRGFNIQYTTICTNKMTGFRGVIESPNFPNDYPQDQNCVWDIAVYEGNKINISFSHFALERSTTLGNNSCTFDYVEIEYGTGTPYGDNDIEWQKYDRYCGDRNPGFITLNTNLAKIHFVSDSLLLGTGFRLEWQLFGCGGILTDNSGTIQSPNYPNPYPQNVECNWLITAPLGQSVSIQFHEIDVEKDSSCTYDFIEIFNGKDDTYQQIAKFCHQIKPITVTSTGNDMFVKFKADVSYEGRGFKASYKTSHTNCGGLLTASKGYIFSPNYPKNFNKDETCEWLIDIDEHHLIELKFEDVDLVKSAKCNTNYIKVYDGPTQAYPVLETICGTTTTPNKTIRSTYEHMLIEFRSDYYLTSKGFKALYSKACGAKIKTSGSGQIQFRKEFDLLSQGLYDETNINCSYIIEAEDTSKHVTLTITKLDSGMVWCDQESTAIKIYNGPFNDSPLIGEYCESKIPPPITSDGYALRIEIHKEIDLFATYSVLDNHCGGDLQSQDGFMATPGWPKSYPINAQCAWTISMGPGNTISFNFINFDIPESENCNTDFLEIRETNATGKILGVFCGTDMATNISSVGPVYLIFKSSRLEEGVVATKKGFYAEYVTSPSNTLSGSEGFIGNQHYPNPYPSGSYGSHSWLITTNSSTIIELTFIEFFIETNSQTAECYGNVMKVYDGMDSDAPVLNELCSSSPPDPILSTSNMMYITIEYYTSRTETKFLLKWKELAKKSGVTANTTSNTTGSDCRYYYKIEGQSKVNLTSPGYPTPYAPNLNCEWIYETSPQYHLMIKFTDMNFGAWGVYRFCTYADTVRIYTKRDTIWELQKEMCNNIKSEEEIQGSNVMKVEFRTNRYLNGPGFQAEVIGVCGGTVTEPSGVIELDKDRAFNSQCQWNITVRPGRTIKLTFDRFELGPNDPNNCRTYLIIRNGKFPDSPLLGKGKFCGSDPPPDLESTSNHIYLKYNGRPNSKGFKIKYNEVSMDCGQDIRLSPDETSAEITSPNYPNIPQLHSECIWTIRAPPGEALRVDFEERFDISQYSRCTTDYVELRDGGTELSPLIGRYCYETPSTQFSTDNMLRIKYFTDSNEPRNGFKAKISISYCGGTLHGEGMISTKEPHVIRAGNNCTWYLKAPLDYYIVIRFLKFRVAQLSVNCSGEDTGKLSIHETSSISGNDLDLGTFCGRINRTEITSSTNEVRVNYLAKSDVDEFRLNFTIVKEDCGGTYVQESGTILSPGYPLMNHENRYCYWKIKVPKGRRISFFVEDMDLGITFTMLLIFHGYSEGPKLVGLEDIRVQQTYETSDNGAHIWYWQETSSNKRGFKIKFTSDKPSICNGDFNTTSGEILSPKSTPTYRCEYSHSQSLTGETLAVTIDMKTNATNRGINQVCPRSNTGIQIYSQNVQNLDYRICQSTNNRPVIFRTTFPITTLVARQNSNTSLNFTISFKTFKCGGLLENDEGNISSPNFPSTLQDSFECSWRIKLQSSSSKIKINFTTLDLGDDCDKSYVVIYNGWSPLHPKVGKYCQNSKPELIISQKNYLLIEYKYEKGGNNQSKGFSLKYEPEIHGCGGIYQSRNAIIQTPNYGKQYDNNQECIWDIRATDGNMITLTFTGRFYIEDSENCTKDYVEIFDWKDVKWVSLGKRCGRNLPEKIISSSNQLRILFRSNDKITGDGFRASWDWHCGGIFEAAKEERYLMSPGYPNTYMPRSNTNCTYKIISKNYEGIVTIRFIDFNLGAGTRSNCAYSNLTITGTSRLPNYLKRVFCGNDIPDVQRHKGNVVITFMSSARYFDWSAGFKLAYKDETCGGNITSPAALESPHIDSIPQPGIYKFYQPRVPCVWYITAPPGQLPVFSIHKLNTTLASHCSLHSLEVYDGLKPIPRKRLAQLCGNIKEETPIPSTSNTMLIKLEPTPFHSINFKGEIYFTYGPSVGCGGIINLNETKYINAPNNLPHMDCHWTVVAPRDHKVQMEFTDISISTSCENPIRNHTYYCTCSYVEVRDGGGPFADQMGKLCSSDNKSKRTLTTSWNTAYIRLYSAVPQNNIFRLTLTPIQSKCGPSLLTASKQLQELTSPDYPNSYPEEIKCTWVIENPKAMGKVMIHFEDLDFPGDSPLICDSDRLELMEDPIRHIISEGFGPTARYQLQTSFRNSREALKYAFCEKTKPFDYYSAGAEVTLTFHSVPYSGNKGKGFKLKYGTAGCNRTIYANEGRLQNDASNADESNCIITITAAPNRTISIYFINFYFLTSDSACSSLGFEIRENNSTGPELLKSCGFRLPSPVFSNSNQLYIRTYNFQGGLGFHFRYNFMYVSSDKGKGCGGKLFNYMGKLSSPMYPNPYRVNIECTWDIMVPKGYKAALKVTDFNIGGGCMKNKLVITTYSEEAETDHTFCAGNNPAVMFSDNILRVTYYSSVNNGGNGWQAVFQAIKEEEESNNLLWF